MDAAIQKTAEKLDFVSKDKEALRLKEEIEWDQ